MSSETARERLKLLLQVQAKAAIERMLDDMITVEDTHYINMLGASLDTDTQTISFTYEILQRPDMNDLYRDDDEEFFK